MSSMREKQSAIASIEVKAHLRHTFYTHKRDYSTIKIPLNDGRGLMLLLAGCRWPTMFAFTWTWALLQVWWWGLRALRD